MISVIIPCYNAEATIVACVSSVLNQSYGDIELIVVDDGSQDQSMLLLKQYLAQTAPTVPVMIFSQENQGVSSARNTGIRLAKGEWVAFLDSDDYWNANKLEVQLDVAQRYPHFALVGTAYNELRFAAEKELIEVNFSQLLARNYFNTPAVMVKKGVLRENQFSEDQRHSEDYRLWLLICKKHRACYINKVLARSISNKAVYGESGLSANLWAMEKGELSNYKHLWKKGYISTAQFGTFSCLSMFKFLYRFVKVRLRN